MTVSDHHDRRSQLTRALEHEDPSVRLRAALEAGTHPDPTLAGLLVDRCSTESDFYVRDMLTWALTRLPTSLSVPLVIQALEHGAGRARGRFGVDGVGAGGDLSRTD